eukprot:INCI18098.1.p1 GENE.INCI18098.1~~INCI18098.1.p1  ORF type:complete len:1351 (+),score=240.12 INCI18098.1:202-4053(+)
MADLEILNTFTHCVWVTTMKRGFSQYVFANKATLEVWGCTSEDMLEMDLESHESESTQRKRDMLYELVQVGENRFGPALQTVYPSGSSVTFEVVGWPLRLNYQGQPQTFICVCGYEQNSLAEGLREQLRALEMQRHSPVLLMLFDSATEAMLASSPSASEFYSRYSADDRAKFEKSHVPGDERWTFKKQTLSSILRFSMLEAPQSDDSPSQNVTGDTLIPRLQQLRVWDEPITVEVLKYPRTCDDGTRRWHRMQFVAIQDPATGSTVLSMSETEVTRIKEVQAALKRKEYEQQDFFQKIVHELRTPLHGITHILRRTLARVPRQFKSGLSLALSQSQQLLSLVNDIMDAATIANYSGLSVAKERVNICRVISRSVAIIQPQISRYKRLVNEAVGSQLFVMGDANRLQQVLTNVIGNAVKFTARGNITVSVEDCVGSSDPNKTGMILVKVTDEGRGIPADKLPHIFDKFNRGDEEGVRSIAGTGLGLALCRSLVEAHGGRFFVKSEVGVGSEFSFTVPADQATTGNTNNGHERSDGRPFTEDEDDSVGDGLDSTIAAPAGADTPVDQQLRAKDAEITSLKRELQALQMRLAQAQAHNAASNPNNSNGHSAPGNTDSALVKAAASPNASSVTRRPCHSDLFGVVEILSVDDHPVNQMVIENIVASMEGYKVTACMDGFSALQLVEQREYLPDLILLDVMMPGTSGYEVCTKLRQKYKPSALPVIMVSAKNREKEIVAGLKSGANDYITKPFNRTELVARMEMQLRLKNVWLVEQEAHQTSELLSEMLPSHIITRLKGGERLIADGHEEVTLMFSDIVCFTDLVARLDTMQVVQLLNDVFSCFDALTDECGVYKVETIGDAYLVVAGHNADTADDHAQRVFRFAQRMLKACEDIPIPDGKAHVGKLHVQVRVGIHTGHAFSGVVGHKMPRYCFFGDTVNSAARLKSNGYGTTIHCSDTTASLLKADPEFGDLSFARYAIRRAKDGSARQTYLAKLGNYKEALRVKGVQDVRDLSRPEGPPSPPSCTPTRVSGSSHSQSMIFDSTSPKAHDRTDPSKKKQQISDTAHREKKLLQASMQTLQARLEAVIEEAKTSKEAVKAQTEAAAQAQRKMLEDRRAQQKELDTERRERLELNSENHHLADRVAALQHDLAIAETKLATLAKKSLQPEGAVSAADTSSRASPVNSVSASAIEDAQRQRAASAIGTMDCSHTSIESHSLQQFLRSISAEQYFHVLQREEIGIELLPMMSDKQLREVGVVSLGARLAIRRAAQQLSVDFKGDDRRNSN